MESAIVVLLGIVVAILVFALDLRVQAITILGRPNLRRRVYRASGVCFGFGLLFLVIGMLVYFELLIWATWVTWIATGSILIISVAMPLLVQGSRLGKTGNDLAKFAHDIYTTSKTLKIIAIVIIVILFVALGILSLPYVFK